MSEDSRTDFVIGDEWELGGGRAEKVLKVAAASSAGMAWPASRVAKTPSRRDECGEDAAGGLAGRLPPVAAPLATGRVEDEQSSNDSSDDRASKAVHRQLDLVSGHRERHHDLRG